MDLNHTRDPTSGREGLDLLRRVREPDDTLLVVAMNRSDRSGCRAVLRLPIGDAAAP